MLPELRSLVFLRMHEIVMGKRINISACHGKVKKEKALH